MSNVANRLVSNEQLYNQYKQQQQQKNHEHIPDIGELLDMCCQEEEKEKGEEEKEGQQQPKKYNKKRQQSKSSKERKSYAASLSSVGKLRKYETVSNNGKTQRVLMPLDEKTKYRDQRKNQKRAKPSSLFNTLKQ